MNTYKAANSKTYSSLINFRFIASERSYEVIKKDNNGQLYIDVIYKDIKSKTKFDGSWSLVIIE